MGYKYKEKFEITPNTYERLYEIAFYKVFANLTRDMPNEKLDYFLEHFCKVYEIDFTSISILKNMYLKKLAPTKSEVAIFNRITEVPIEQVPLDYRTYRKYVKEWVIGGKVELHPLIINAYMRPTIKLFVNSFLGLMYDDIWFIHNLRKVKADETTSGN